MLVLALATPFPIVGKLVVALMMLALVGTLFRITEGPITGPSIVASVGASLVIVTMLEAALPNYFGGLHELGVLAGIVGVVSGATLLRPVQPSPNRQRASGALRLFILACTTGPILGLILAQLTILLDNVSPLDREYTYLVCMTIGTTAGVFGAAIVAFASLARR